LNLGEANSRHHAESAQCFSANHRFETVTQNKEWEKKTSTSTLFYPHIIILNSKVIIKSTVLGARVHAEYFVTSGMDTRYERNVRRYP